MLAFKASIENAVVVIRMLEEVLGRDPVAGLVGVAGHRQIFVHELLGVAPHPAKILVIIAVLLPAAVRWTRFAAIAAPVPAFHVIQVSHHP